MATEESKAPIGVAIVEDQKETREGLFFLINNSPPLVCRHAYDSVEDALAGIGIDPPLVALVDIGLPGLSGIEGVRILRERYPAIAPVLLTVFKDDERIFQAICAGACGYMLKKTPPARLLEAIREIAEGGRRDVAGSGHARGGPVSQVADSRAIGGPVAAGIAPIEAADGRPSE